MTAPMESHCLPFHDIPRTSKLYSTFLDDFSKVAAYYAHPPTAAGVDAAARESKLRPDVRMRVIEILRAQNRNLGSGGEIESATARNLDRLASGAVAIVTGQQAGLFSGPAYTFYKALTVIRCAEEVTRRGIDAVPVFWLATEDHDLAEINHSYWCTRNGLARYELPPEDSGRRVGEIPLGDGIEAVVGAAASTLEGEFAAEVIRALNESYTPRDTYGSAFGKLMARLLAGRGIVFLDQLDPQLHRLAAPTLEHAAQRADQLGSALAARSKELEAAGFHSQVKVTNETTLLFWSKAGRREAVRRKNGSFLVGDTEISARQFIEAIEQQPEQFSPSALLRPAIQDSILPTAAYVGGPAEVAYMAQAQVVYRELGVRMPAILPRASFTIIDPAIARFLAQYGLHLRDLLAGRQQLRSKMEQQSLPGALSSRFDASEEEVRRLMKSFEEPLAKLDPTLMESLHTAEAKVLHQITQLKGKVARAENFRSGVLDRHEKILTDSLTPNGELQERTLCLLPQLAAHGPDLLDKLTSMSSVAGSGEGHSCAAQHQILSF
ncbi:MAG TPA: bacillithiol biosynthesis cysteine-adding enzyme BshC [Candidatus Acidoferrales bacterium]|nr:bacillithiol biosynthesis cysteine-adding enzyme BshC [Candidatus Acidoferrales bacterium]